MGEVIGIPKMGIVPPPKNYYCTKCKKEVSWSETETFFCPCCGRSGLRHKGCGGLVVEKNLIEWGTRY